jgi:hypothetical protein
MKIITTLLFTFFTLSVSSQKSTDSLKIINVLETKLKTLKTELSNQIETVKKTTQKNSILIDSLQRKTVINSNEIAQANEQLGIKITTTENNANQKIQTLDNSLSKNSLYGIIGVLSAILLSGLLYWLLSKKQKSDKTEVETQLSNAKKSIEEEQVQINTKLAELYNGQMELLKQERKANPTSEIDHSLALKVADEIVKMQMNLAHMDSKVRGHKQLTIAVTNVFDNFKANGYEIVDLLNKPYKEGMNMQATMEPDPSLREGEQIIRRIIKPEIQFNNKIIQHAQVIVAYGE